VGVQFPSGGSRLILATLLVVAVSWLSARRPKWGLIPLLVLGATAVGAVVVTHLLLAKSAAEVGPIWPVVLAAAGFLYLWWLAALIFDLVFVWHVYVRQATALDRMRRLCGARLRGRRAVAADDAGGRSAAAART
jgi:hypothetical protein